MRLNVPNFRGIEAFLAAAEAGSMRAAANAMNLSVSAISHRIQVLEEELGVTLFDRSGQSLRLTTAGLRYRDGLLPAIGQMERATTLARSTRDTHKVSVATVPLFYSNWVTPRLSGFLEEFPEARIELLSLDAKSAEDADIILRPVYTQHARSSETKLFGFRGTPICHADLVERHGLREPRDLLDAKLIDLETPLNLWESWFSAAGLSYSMNQNRLVVDSQALMYDAVMQKVGVAIATTFFSQHYMRLGLVRPFDLVCEFRGGIYMSAAREDEAPLIRAFRNWLSREVAATAAEIDRQIHSARIVMV